jgi:hypothetical protein
MTVSKSLLPLRFHARTSMVQQKIDHDEAADCSRLLFTDSRRFFKY